MKLFGLIVLLTISVNTAFATSYWYDYCDEEDIALAQAKKQNPNLLFDGACETLTDLGEPAIVRDGKVEICKTRITYVSFFKNKATYKVSILDPNSNQVFDYKVRMKKGRGGSCRVKAIINL